jgi:signal transduction histidine kinase
VQFRCVVHNLKTGGERLDGLLPAIQRYAHKLSAATGIQVQVQVSNASHVNDRLAADVFHIVTEGPSNIRRHIQAATANIALEHKDGNLIVIICNDRMDWAIFCQFLPCSITERATALGGRVHVDPQDQTHAAGITEILL